MTTILMLVDTVLAFAAVLLWGGYWWMVKTFPEVPLLERFPVTPLRQQLSTSAPIFWGASATCSTPIAGLPPHVRNGISYPDGR